MTDPETRREHRRRRFRRHGKRAYIRSVYLLPSMATLGNAVCGFAAMYVSALLLTAGKVQTTDTWTRWWIQEGFSGPAYLIFFAMLFDALDGRLARFARHTTDFGGQLDSLADVVSFGAAPAFMSLMLLHVTFRDWNVPAWMSRLSWAIGALYFSCAAIRLARFNVSNEHGEQHHFSFFGLPSPGAGGVVAAWILMQQDLASQKNVVASFFSKACIVLLPIIVCGMGLLMVSTIRYSHMVNKYLRGKQPVMKLLFGVGLILLFVICHQYVMAFATLAYALNGPALWVYTRIRRRQTPPLLNA